MTTLIYFIPIILTSLYGILIVYYLYSWKQIHPVDASFQATSTDPFVSVIIAARNEEDHILRCVHSCLNQDYPAHLLEVIVVDDQSDDDTFDLLEHIDDPKFVRMRLGVYKRTTIKGSKKKAIAYGINHAKGDIICATDADCIVSNQWIRSMVLPFGQQKIKLVSGPVIIDEPKSFLDHFQALDFSGNGIINAAGIQSNFHLLCNAANLAYRKKIFLEMDAYEENYNIPSGDDVFLLQKINQNYPDGIAFNKSSDAIVKTIAITSWLEFARQRLRWAGKMSLIKDWKLRWIPALVWLQRVSVYLFLIFGLWTANINLVYINIICLILNWAFDFMIQYEASKFYKINNWYYWFLPVEWIHSLYFIIIGLISWLPISVDWKGRRV